MPVSFTLDLHYTFGLKNSHTLTIYDMGLRKYLENQWGASCNKG